MHLRYATETNKRCKAQQETLRGTVQPLCNCFDASSLSKCNFPVSMRCPIDGRSLKRLRRCCQTPWSQTR